MAGCKDCIHYDICCFHLKGNENERCVQFLPAADVVPKSEVEQAKADVVRKIFAEIDEIDEDTVTYQEFYNRIIRFKEKYMEEQT